MLKTEIKYGIITGLIICFWHLTEFLLGFHSNKMYIGEYTTYFVVIIPLVTLYLGIKEMRDKEKGGYISLGCGIRVGLMISLIASIIFTFYLVIYFNFINSKYFDLSIAYQKGKIITREKTGEKFISEIEQLKFMFSYINQLLFGILGLITSGLIISFTLSMMLKKNHNRTLII